VLLAGAAGWCFCAWPGHFSPPACMQPALRTQSYEQPLLHPPLRYVHRLPVAYKYCLAEVCRRRGWTSVYAQQAARLAEHMGKLRDKEVARREAFLAHMERLMPSELLGAMGLKLQPPLCQVGSAAAGPAVVHVAALHTADCHAA
jgi:hypothetical protein